MVNDVIAVKTVKELSYKNIQIKPVKQVLAGYSSPCQRRLRHPKYFAVVAYCSRYGAIPHQKIADDITKPAITMDRVYEVDELKTFIKNKTKECWVIYAVDKQSKQVVDLKVGGRTRYN